ncbi:MAG: twin-arginine translocase TatA/TatE family subunit [Pirellulaceae bacterium]|nr:twin-arginine translocase TatA/TatE family subunit [Pirellulaceae bacterium]
MFGLGFQELLIVGVVAILLFGKNLPDVARKFGGMYREFRKGLDDLRSQVDFTDTYNSAPSKPRPRRTYSEGDDLDEVSAPKFEPPPSAPQ